MRRTRILVTLGPASSDRETIRQLIEAGADAFRLNFSHGTLETHDAACRAVREAATALGCDVSIVQDLGGPKIRTGPLDHPVVLTDGERLVIERGREPGGNGRVSCAFGALFESVRPGDRLLIDDGRIELRVMRATADRLETDVTNGGTLEASKGINVPGVTLRTPALTDKDRADLAAGIRMGVDLAAISFVQSPDDMRDARRAAADGGAPDLPLIAKIEKPQAVEALEEILDVSDGLMVARGDLGVEIALERVPAVQKRIVEAARARGVPVVLATQVLESMRTEPRPTRAEVTDAAHAVDERVDAIMLAGETAAGLHPVKAVTVLDAIIREAETTVPPLTSGAPAGSPWTPHARGLCEAAAALAEETGAHALIALTRAGKTARLLAALRPKARILAVTPNRQTAARLALVWGVTPVVAESRAIGTVRELLVRRGLIASGDVIVYVSVHAALGHEHMNFVHAETV